jgi:hypothetical protein
MIGLESRLDLSIECFHTVVESFSVVQTEKLIFANAILYKLFKPLVDHQRAGQPNFNSPVSNMLIETLLLPLPFNGTSSFSSKGANLAISYEKRSTFPPPASQNTKASPTWH